MDDEEVRKLKLRCEVGGDYEPHPALVAALCTHALELSAKVQELEGNCRFLLSFVPPWAKDVPEGMGETFYGTLSAEGDKKIKDRVDMIEQALNEE